MNRASQPKSQLRDWADAISRSAADAQEKERLRDARLDKIIAELDSCNIVWYLQYTGGNDIAMSNLSYKEDDNVTDKMHDNFVLQQKRRIVEQCIIPAMHACIRAGLLKPSDEQ